MMSRRRSQGHRKDKPSHERRRHTHRGEGPELGGAVAVPADRRLRIPLQLPHGCVGRGGRGDRLALLPRLRRAERLRQPARPGSRVHAPRAVWHQPPVCASVRAGDERPRDDLEDADGLDRRPGCPDDGALRGRGFRHAAHAADATGAGQTFRLLSDLALGIEGNRVRGRHVLQEGKRAFCCMTWAAGLAGPRSVEEADKRMAATTRFWRGWLGSARIPDHRWRDPIQRSALAIKGLTYMPTGATVAALTTSLPETPRGERNWDYRYTWMRDSTFTLQALHWLNLDWEADEFMEFVADLKAN